MTALIVKFLDATMIPEKSLCELFTQFFIRKGMDLIARGHYNIETVLT